MCAFDSVHQFSSLTCLKLHLTNSGSGKTFTYLKLAAQQEKLFKEPFSELITICSTSNKFDKTVNSFKDCITKSKVVALKDTDLLDWLNKFMRRTLNIIQ